MEHEMPPCDTCGKPATMLARDILQTDDWHLPDYVIKSVGGTKAGCAEHPVKSDTHVSMATVPLPALALGRE